MPAQDASVGIEATYFNPAGLMKLNNGFHISLSNQTIGQNKKVTNYYPLLNEPVYNGKVSAPVFPSVYAVYKMDKLAFSFGFNAIGGGGGATFAKGLPSFELGVSDLVPTLAAQGATAYRLDAYFEGTSVFFGYQGGVSYKINDMISVFAGARYVTAKNTYVGHLNDVGLLMGGTWMRADAVFNGLVGNLNGMIAIPTTLQPLVGLGLGGMTLDQVVALNNPAFTAANAASIKGGLAAIGVDAATANAMPLTTIQGAFTAATPTLTTKRNTSAATAKLLRNQSADAEQTGSGITPIFGVNISPNEKLNIGIKFEMATKIELTNKTKKDFTTKYLPTGDSVTMFKNGEKLRNDMPAMLSIGVSYKVTEKLLANVGGHYYFDKTANYGKKLNGEYVGNDSVIDNNFYEIALGLQYNISEKLLVSGGYLYAKTGVNENYQSDLSYSLTSNTIGLGGKFQVNDMIGVNLGFGYTIYSDGEKTIEHLNPAGTNVLARETYYKDNWFVGIGVDFSF
jgi:long-chain fatty acid transport protein